MYHNQAAINFINYDAKLPLLKSETTIPIFLTLNMQYHSMQTERECVTGLIESIG